MSDFIPDRLNEVPAVFNGCSWGELAIVAGGSATTLLIISIVIWLCGAIWLVIPPIVMLGTLLSIIIISKVMMRAKNGKPPGYYATRIAVIKKRCGLSDVKMIIASRTWDIEK